MFNFFFDHLACFMFLEMRFVDKLNRSQNAKNILQRYLFIYLFVYIIL